MDIVTNVRVVRGPDWKSGNQDGGEGHVGAVVEVKAVHSGSASATIVVQWDNGNRNEYPYGSGELRVFDNAPAGVQHSHVMCDSCRQQNVTGIRWKCNQCYDYDLCSKCYNAGRHSVDHTFIRIDHMDGPKIPVPPRKNARKVVAMGLFQDATVVRGHDWKWEDQDGGPGKTGILQTFQGWAEEHNDTRNAARVEWSGSHKGNVYRIVYKGKVDLKYVQPASGGNYYPEHLPVLGTSYASPVRSEIIKSGDNVKVHVELAEFRKMQAGHGGWADQMSETLKSFGKVTAVLDSGDLRVLYPSKKTWTINAAAVSKVPAYSVGDTVRVINDAAKIRSLQEGHGGWVDEMRSSVGKVGRVKVVFPDADVKVDVEGQTWTYNPYCMMPAHGERLSIASPTAEPEGGLRMGLMTLLEGPLMLAAASAGDVSTIRSRLERNPQRVNARFMGKALIHCAAAAGNVALLQLLQEFKADLEIEDEDGDKPLHVCAYGDREQVAKALIDAGANVNAQNNKGHTPLIIASYKGKYGVLRLLATNRKIQIDMQDSDGDTALHCAAIAGKSESVTILLDAQANPAILNKRCFTPIHLAAKKGFTLGVKEFISRFPQHINLPKEDGYTALHLAALNDNGDVVTLLAQESACEVDAKNNKNQTALHLAAYQCHPRIVERLVGYGAVLNVQDTYGDTPLHDALAKMTPLTIRHSDDTPQLNKVRDEYGIPPGSGRATIACFLVQEGADTSIRNKKGNTPLHKCTPDIAEFVNAAARKQGSGSYRGSLRGRKLVSPQPKALQPKAPAKKVVKISFSDLNFGEKVGSGGFGTVFKGHWKSKGLDVAIKRLQTQIRKEEVEILSQLEHPNIIEFYGEASGPNSQYVIVTAYATGGSLFDFIHTKKTCVNQEQNMQWSREIARGMKYLHQRDIIHRDLKSCNVLLTSDLVTKICDFGAAKEFVHTTVQTATGTVLWIAPEVLKGDPSSLSCDVYSYGMVLYEIFTCKLPFGDVKTAFQVASKKMNGEVPAIPNGVEPDIVSLMHRCWEITPRSRPSFQEIVSILDTGENADEEHPASSKDQQPVGVSSTDGITDSSKTLTLADLPMLQTKLESVSGLWYPLGMELNVDANILGGIPRVAGNDPSHCLSVMLMRWLQIKDPTQSPTLDTLTKSLCKPSIAGGEDVAKLLSE